MSRQQAVIESAAPTEAQARIWDAFRRWGYLQANLDPLGDLQPVNLPELAVSGPDADAARKIYCGTIGVEFMHISDPERRRWIEERMESAAPASTPAAEQKAILDRLVRAEIFEQVLADALSRNQALLARRRVRASAASRRHPQCRLRARRAASRPGDEPPRPAQRDGAHRRPSGGGSFREIRRCGSA